MASTHRQPTKRHRSGRRPRVGPAVAALVVAAIVAACTVDVSDGDLAGERGLLFVADDATVTDVTDATIADVEAYWDRELPAVWGREFVAVARLAPYDSASGPASSLPRCGTDTVPRREAVNAFYCPASDTIAWDAEVLFRDLLVIGDLAVATVLAHEYGHAIQLRTGAFDDATGEGAAVVLELQADCYAGAWLGDLATRRDARDSGELDEAVAGLLAVRDPVGMGALEESAHGNSFDRLGALTEGFTEGATACATYPATPPVVTARSFSRSERPNGGDMPFDELEPLLGDGLDAAWDRFAATLGAVTSDPASPSRPAPPEIVLVAAGMDPPDCDGESFAAADIGGLSVACPRDGRILVDGDGLVTRLAGLGDFATTYPIVHSWGQMLTPDGADPLTTGDCVAGAWSRAVFDGDLPLPLSLSPGDLDEAVATFALYAPPEPASTVRIVDSTFSRYADLRRGFLGGPAACAS